VNRRQLLSRSLRFHWRGHLGVVMGTAVAAAVLIGALVVGDSVRGTLRDRALERLGPTSVAVRMKDRFFRTDLVEGLGNFSKPPNVDPRLPLQRLAAEPLLIIPGMASRQDGTARANQIQVIGWTTGFSHFATGGGPLDLPASALTHSNLATDSVVLNPALARQLKAEVGQRIIVRVHKPSALSREAIITPRDDASVALRLVVVGIQQPKALGNLDLDSAQGTPLNAFVPLPTLTRATGLDGQVNTLLVASPQLITRSWQERLWDFVVDDVCSVPLLRPLARPLIPTLFKMRERAGQPRPLEDMNLLTSLLERWLRDPVFGWLPRELGLDLRPVGGEDPSVARTTNPPAAYVELTSKQIFLEPAVVRAGLETRFDPDLLPLLRLGSPNGWPELTNTLTPVPLLTYLVNTLEAGDRVTPYSMVTAAGPPYTPADLGDDEIVINDWLAKDLAVGPGSTIRVRYYRADAGSQLTELTNEFRVRAVVPITGLRDDRTLMPEFPGLSKAESTHDWDAGFPLVHPIRTQDESYWKNHRGTPKAFVSLATGQRLWGNRFGDLTAIRWFVPGPMGERITADQRLAVLRHWPAIEARLRANLNPADLGFRFEPVRERALKAASSGQDFGGLFLGFSFFLIVAALLLTALLFRFGLEQRATELGTLLALGWEPRRVTRLFLREGVALAVIGAVLGAAGGAFYARMVLRGLNSIWSDAVAGAQLQFHLSAGTLAGGLVGSIGVAILTLWLTLRQAARKPARELLNEGWQESAAGPRPQTSWRRWLPIACLALALGLAVAAVAAPAASRPGLFFGAGALALIGLLGVVGGRLRRPAGPAPAETFGAFARRAPARQPARSLSTVALLACGVFLIAAVAANRLDATRDAARRDSGTGGFALWGQASLPLLRDLNSASGREQYGLSEADMAGVSVVPLRVRDGDEASCLNLDRAQRPRLLGVRPSALADRGAFSFAAVAKGPERREGWKLLETSLPSQDIPEIPAIGDANSIQWALGKSVGDALDYVDERGRPFRVRLVASVANSILQGSLLIDDAAFTRLFPAESGARTLLIDVADPARIETVRTTLGRALQDQGVELVSTVERLNRFNAVQNTYLHTFQVLGGLGLLLGSVGLGLVVLRNVFERRAELAVLLAIGFSAGRLRQMILREHVLLLLLGLAVGSGAALIAIAPVLLGSAGGFPWRSLGLTFVAVLANGLLWTWIATQRACRGHLLAALRGE
jgi:putative ABC transport system permease protein